jgi:hypothetical protein
LAEKLDRFDRNLKGYLKSYERLKIE